jgi:hypothetical protein
MAAEVRIWPECPTCIGPDGEPCGMAQDDRTSDDRYWPCPTCAAFHAALDAAKAEAWDEGCSYGRAFDYAIRMCGKEKVNPYRPVKVEAPPVAWDDLPKVGAHLKPNPPCATCGGTRGKYLLCVDERGDDCGEEWEPCPQCAAPAQGRGA